MYQHFRNDLIKELYDAENCTLEQFLCVLDKVSLDYKIEKVSTDLVVYEDYEVPKLVKTYIASKYTENASRKTIDGYFIILNQFFKYLRVQPGEVTAEHIRIWLYNYQKDHAVSDRTLDQYRIVINCFFTWSFDNGYISSNPGKLVKKIKHEKPKRIAVPREDIEKIRYYCRSDSELALLEFMYSTGCRAEEICSVRVDDIDFDDGSISIVGKGRKRRTVFLTPKAIFYVKKYIENRGFEAEYLFCSERKPHNQIEPNTLFRRVKKMIKTAGIKENYSPHNFRHSTATHLIENGMEIRDVQMILGHENIGTTSIYIDNDERGLKQKHNKYMR